MVELENEDPTAFKNLMRMEPAMFIDRGSTVTQPPTRCRRSPTDRKSIVD